MAVKFSAKMLTPKHLEHTERNEEQATRKLLPPLKAMIRTYTYSKICDKLRT